MEEEITVNVPFGGEKREWKPEGKSIETDREKLQKQIKQVLEAQPLAVLATHGDIFPYMNLLAFASDDKLKYLLFSTATATRKYENLSRNPAVALLIDSRKNLVSDLSEAVAVTALGKAEEVQDFERQVMEKIYLMKHPHLADFLHSPTSAFLKVKVEKYIFVDRFQHVLEFSV